MAATPAVSGIAQGRLMEERKKWRRDHPHGFFAKPIKDKETGSLNMFKWRCGVPGVEGTCWEGGVYKLTMEFSEDYPNKPPKCQFNPPLYHPNIYPSGTVCLSILSEEKGWKPSITIKQILVGVQMLLDDPNIEDPAQSAAYECYVNDRAEYDRNIVRQARENAP